MRGAIKLAVIGIAAAAATVAIGRGLTGRTPRATVVLAGAALGTLAVVAADLLIGW